MIIVDDALRRRQADGNPVRVALVGAGFMGRGVTNQIVNSVPGMELVAIVNRTIANAERAYREAGVERIALVDDAATLDEVVATGACAVTQDLRAVTQSDCVDVVIDATGNVEYGCELALSAIENRKHLVLMNAEVDGTVGAILKHRADAAGVVITGCDGDQPGVQGNLVRFVKSIGVTPLVAGNIKGLQDPYRTPTTQAAFAAQWGQDPRMVTSFADGTKISFEQAIVANAFGFTIEKRGMRGSDHRGPVDDLTTHFDVDALRELGGVVDYVVGATPSPGVYVLGTHDDPKQRHYLNLYKLGPGPLYCFYTPYHLCHFEVPMTAARAAIFGDAALAPAGAPTVEVITVAKRDLPAGTTIDGLGGYDSYGVAERADVTRRDGLLPMGVAEGCVLRRPVRRDEPIGYADVVVPSGRLVDALRAEQDARLEPPSR